MRKIMIAAACAALLSGPAFAQTSQPQGGANQSPTSPTSDMSKDGMKKGTTGMSNDSMRKDGMKNDGMSKDKMHKDGMKNNMSK